MIIQWLLVGALALTALYAMAQAHTPRVVRWPALAASLAGIYLVLHPALANTIAAALGVGRGADLLLYCWVVVSLALFAHLQLGLLRAKENFTELARAVALATPQRPAELPAERPPELPAAHAERVAAGP